MGNKFITLFLLVVAPMVINSCGLARDGQEFSSPDCSWVEKPMEIFYLNKGVASILEIPSGNKKEIKKDAGKFSLSPDYNRVLFINYKYTNNVTRPLCFYEVLNLRTNQIEFQGSLSWFIDSFWTNDSNGLVIKREDGFSVFDFKNQTARDVPNINDVFSGQTSSRLVWTIGDKAEPYLCYTGESGKDCIKKEIFKFSSVSSGGMQRGLTVDDVVLDEPYYIVKSFDGTTEMYLKAVLKETGLFIKDSSGERMICKARYYPTPLGFSQNNQYALFELDGKLYLVHVVSGKIGLLTNGNVGDFYLVNG